MADNKKGDIPRTPSGEIDWVEFARQRALYNKPPLKRLNRGNPPKKRFQNIDLNFD